MADSKEKTSYNHIFKTTFVFGFVQVFKAVLSIIRNKLVAILIGTEGMGLMGIFISTITMIKTGAGLGLDQSAVRDVSEAYGSKNKERYSRIIKVTTRMVLLTGLLGMLITLIMSHWLSVWTLGGNEYTISYCFLGIGVFLDILNDGLQALLKGTRQLKSLAYASMFGSVVGLLTTVPLFYWLGMDGIVPALLIASALGLLVSEYFLRKIDVEKVNMSLKELLVNSKPMLMMGSAMMLMTFLNTIVSLIIQSFIRYRGGLNDVGLFSAGSAILQSYFGIVITALMTDYYPRIAAVNKDNRIIQDELNKQSLVSLLMCCPLFVVFISFLPIFINILYTPAFLPAIDYVNFAIYYTIITVCSNQVDLILVAKYKISTFTLISLFMRFFQLILYILLYSFLGLKGLGIATLCFGVVHYLVMTTVVNRLYRIHFNVMFYKVAVIVMMLCITSSTISCINSLVTRYILGALLSVVSVFFSLRISKNYIGLDLVKIVMSKFIK